MAMQKAIFRRVNAGCFVPGETFARRAERWLLYQRPTFHSTRMASSAASENQAMLDWPWGTTMKAASNGPEDDPIWPPTWNTDCAKPWRPPEAARAMREDSGWKTEEPIPPSAAATSSKAQGSAGEGR